MPWLEEHASPKGVLTHHPWCIIPRLQALGDVSVLGLLLSSKIVKGYDQDEPLDAESQALDLSMR